jgi:small-conductance mechanosensitive channel
MPVSPVLKQLIRRTGILFAVFLAAVILPVVTEFPPTIERRATIALHVVAVLAIFFQAVIWSNALVNHWRNVYIERYRAEYGAATTIGALAAFIRFACIVILLSLALDALGVPVKPLFAGLGIGGIAIAFALQNILGDIFAALSIVLDKPFVVGDAIQVDTFSGRVERIGIKSTRVRSDTGEQLVFANGDLLRGRLRNFELMKERRVTLVTRVAGDTSADQLTRIPGILKELVDAQPGTRFARSHLRQIGDTTLDFETVYFLEDPAYGLMMDTQHALQIAVVRRFASEAIFLATQLETAVKRKAAGLA